MSLIGHDGGRWPGFSGQNRVCWGRRGGRGLCTCHFWIANQASESNEEERKSEHDGSTIVQRKLIRVQNERMVAECSKERGGSATNFITPERQK